MHDVCGGFVCMMRVHKMSADCLKSLCVCKHDVTVLFLPMCCVSACMLCLSVRRLAKMVFAAVHVFFVRMYVDYLVFFVNAVCVSEICMRFVSEGLVYMMCVGDLYACVWGICMHDVWGTCMHDVCGGLLCMMCVGLVCIMCVGLVCMMCEGDSYA